LLFWSIFFREVSSFEPYSFESESCGAVTFSEFSPSAFSDNDSLIEPSSDLAELTSSSMQGD